jgi:hypothetical protein
MEIHDFETKDLYFAGLLCARNESDFYGLRKDGKIFWFLFHNKNECEKLQQLYFIRKAEVDARTYSDAIRMLKDSMYMFINNTSV